MKRYFEVLDTEPDKGAKDWANTFAEDGKFVNGEMILEGSKGMWEVIGETIIADYCPKSSRTRTP